MITDAQFKSSVETLTQVITSSLSRGQLTNAEKYINYFFDVLYKCYSKGKYDSQKMAALSHEAKPSIRPDFIGFLEDQLYSLINTNIRPENYYTYRFINLHFVKMLERLIENGHSEAAMRIIWYYPLVSVKLLTLSGDFQDTEKRWYEQSSFVIFEDLFSETIGTVEAGNLIAFLKMLLKTIVDYNKQELLEEIIQILMNRYPLSSIGNSNITHILTSNSFFGNDKLYSELVSTPWTYDQLTKKRSFFREHLSTPSLTGYLNEIEYYLQDQYKHNQIRLALLTGMIYAFYKGKYSLFRTYLEAHQPNDSDATWTATDFAFAEHDVVRLISLEDDIIEDAILRVGHHGFKLYFYRIIAFYLIKANLEEQNLQNVLIFENSNQANNVAFTLEAVKRLSPAYLTKIYPSLAMEQNQFEAIIDRYINYAKEKFQSLELAELRNIQIDQDKWELAKKVYSDGFTKQAIFFQLDGIKEVHASKKLKKAPLSIGTFRQVQKPFFGEGPEQGLIDWTAHQAKESAVRFDRLIANEIAQSITPIEVRKHDLKKLLRKDAKNFDLIISTPIALFSELDFIAKQQLTDLPFEGSESYKGRALKHYEVILIPQFQNNDHLLLLNSKDIGELRFFNDPKNREKDREGVFAAELTDLTKLSQAQAEQLYGQGGDYRKRLLFDMRAYINFKISKNIKAKLLKIVP
jgi:hypothetical protein